MPNCSSIPLGVSTGPFFLRCFFFGVGSVTPELPSKSATAVDVPAAGQVDQVFKTIMAADNEEIVKKTNAVFAFQVKGAEEGQWYLDLKNGSGSCGKGESPSPPDATLIMDSQDFIKMFQGNHFEIKWKNL